MKRTKATRQASGSGWSFNPDQRSPQQAQQSASNSKVIKLRMERRRGKPTTILYEMQGVPQPNELARKLKQMLSVGGTSKGDTIELQGEHRDRLRVYLKEQGYGVKG